MLNQNLLLAGDDAYNLTRSLRFRSSVSAYLNRTFATGNRLLFTFSAWVKRGSLTGNQNIFGPDTSTSGSGTYGVLRFVDGNLEAFDYTNGTINWYLSTTPVYRDPSAWYHIVMAYDSAQATSSNRVKLYVNGVQITSFGTANYPTSSYQGQWNNNLTHYLGTAQIGSSNQYFDGYMTEVNFIDGQALTPSSFGETDAATGVWKPKKFSGTYGTNGFYLKFTDNSSLSALGTDSSGNGNTWTVNNFSVTSTSSAYDSMTDVPTLTDTDTANYWTLNPLNTGQLGTVQSGNLEWIGGDQNNFRTVAAQILPTTGKFYWEVTPIGGGSGGAFVSGIYIGIMNYANGGTGLFASGVRIADTGRDDYVYYSDGRKVNSNSFVSYGNSYAANDVIGIAVDIDNGKIWYSKNGTWQASGDPAAGTNAAYTTVPFSTKTYAPAMSAAEITNAQKFNFGQRPFAYTPPTGFKALNTFNLPTPTIGATASTQAGKYFNPVLYTGNGSTQSVTGVGFQPDFTWVKVRSSTQNHSFNDAVRGAGYYLVPNATAAERLQGEFDSFDSDGFSLTYNAAEGDYNASTKTYVAWNWKANGSGSTNTAGSITSTVSANTTAGFSIVTYTGTGSNATVGHGLGVAPSMVIVKRRDAGASPWNVWHTSLTSGTYFLVLNDTVAQASGATRFTALPTSTVINIGTDGDVNANTGTYVAYNFAQVAGYSAFGSYTGNGSTDGPFVYTGFRPKYVLIKASSIAGENWYVVDATRSPYNAAILYLSPNNSGAEASPGAAQFFDFLSNGFKLRVSGSYANSSGETYIYMAFAENPFKYSLAR